MNEFMPNAANSLLSVEFIPGRRPVDEKTREQWARAGARTRLAAARLRRGVRQEDLAAAIGISTASLRRIESGQNGSGVDVGILLSAATILQIPGDAQGHGCRRRVV
jgi:DNA-binding XRE family transcriptional regulator